MAAHSIESIHPFTADIATAKAAAKAYYDGSDSPLTDAEYDALIDRIETAVAADPTLDHDGVLDQVAAGASAGGDVTHPKPMLSLSKTKTLDDLTTFTGNLGAPVIVEPKLDGLAIRAEYTNGALTLVATRGDGTTGENVTTQATHINGLPTRITHTGHLEVRGEVYMTDDDFAASNDARIASGRPGFSNPRNATAGSLRRVDSDYTATMSFAAYDATGDSITQPTYTDRMNAIAALGITTAVTLLTAIPIDTTPTTSSATIIDRVNALETARPTIGYPIDGAVIKVEGIADRDRLGAASRTPRWATSYKYAADTATSVITAVDVSIGRTGRMGIRVVVEPTSVGGTVIGYASGHNVPWMRGQRLGVGTRVSLYRAGDVIPRAISLPADQQPATATAWEPPATCPQCDQPWDTSSVLWRCLSPECSVQGAIEYAASRDVLDIEGMSTAVVSALIEGELVTNVADLFTLTEAQLAALPMGVTSTGLVRTLGAKNAAKVHASLQTAKSQPLNRIITALNIRKVGRTMGRRLAAAFPTMAALQAATTDQLAQVEGIGTDKADTIHAGLAARVDVITRLAAAGVNMGSKPSADSTASPLAGGTYVVSGSVPGFTRTTIQEAIESKGGKASSSVSKNTTALVTSETTTSKAQKAAALGIPIIDPTEFAALLNT